MPVNSVLIVLTVGGLILEAASHAPILGAFMPRVLQVAGWLAAVGWAFDALNLFQADSSATAASGSGQKQEESKDDAGSKSN